MSDWLVELGANPTSRSIVKSLGLPIPLPAALPRDRDAWRTGLLSGRRFLFESQSPLQGTFEALGATRATLGDGGHSGKHGGAIFPDTLRWLWRDWPKP